MVGVDNIIDAEKEFEINALKSKVEKLTHEITKYKILLNEVDEGINPDIISDEEAICVEQIHKLKQYSSNRELSTDEVKRLDLLHKNLKLARGENARVGGKSQASKLSETDLAEIVKGN